MNIFIKFLYFIQFFFNFPLFFLSKIMLTYLQYQIIWLFYLTNKRVFIVQLICNLIIFWYLLLIDFFKNPIFLLKPKIKSKISIFTKNSRTMPKYPLFNISYILFFRPFLLWFKHRFSYTVKRRIEIKEQGNRCYFHSLLRAAFVANSYFTIEL